MKILHKWAQNSVFLLFCYLFCSTTPAQGQQLPATNKTVQEQHGEPQLPDYFLEELKEDEKNNGGRFYKEFLNMLMTLGLIIGVLFVILFLFKKLLHTRAQQINIQSTIKIIEQRALSSKSSLYLLEVGGTSLLISDSPAGVHLITHISTQGSTSFREILEKE